MKGHKENTPIPPFGGSEQYSCSPDAKKIALTTEAVVHNTSWTTGYNIYVIDVDDDAESVGEPQLLTGYT